MTALVVMHDDHFRLITATCARLCGDANARAVFLIDKNGQLIACAGDTERVDSTSLASLVAGEIAATGGLAKLLGEKDFSVLFHEGTRDNLHISLVAGRVILVVLFDRRSSLGLVRLRVKKASEEFGTIFDALLERSRDPRANPVFSEITEDDIDNLFGD
jgi:predicted regulator of Ras-like GTPase activity (Roadblock/LC7/MglB family)